LIRRGLTRIDLFQEPRLLVTARHNLIVFMTDGGLYQEAEDSLAETRSTRRPWSAASWRTTSASARSASEARRGAASWSGA
jgi:hypothetical protein